MTKSIREKDVNMIVAQVLPSLRQGGVERGTIEIAAALQKDGIKNYVISSGGPMTVELERIGVEHILLPVQTKNPVKILVNTYRLEKILKEKKISLVHVRSRAPAWSVRTACHRLGIPFITTFHGLYGLKPFFLKKLYNRIMVQGKIVIAVSAFVKQHIVEKYGVPESKIQLIPRGVDVERFDEQKISQTALQKLIKEHDIEQNKPIIVLVGRMSRIKGHFLLLNAIRQMKHQNLTLVFIGGNPKGTYDMELQKALKKLPSSVSFKMFALTSSQMPLGYALSDICVQPTLQPETFGRSMAEAQAMGRLVVAAAHGGACELIQDGKTGFLFAPGNAADLAKVLDKLLDMTPQQKQAVCEQARVFSRTNYSIQNMCDKTLNVYREVLGKTL